jgi:tetratricopeptide (TPR) repeat protein
MDGRSSVSFNPILQSMSDAVKAAGRAGRKDLGLTIKNASKANKYNPNGQGHIEAEVIKTLTFEERTPDAIKALPTEFTIFSMNPDGSMDVIQIMDPRLLNSIRSTYKDTWVVTDIANKITSGIGQMHTRYNYNFAPLNFVRDALTNAWAIGADMGLKESARFISEVAEKVSSRGVLGKAYKVAKMYDSKNLGLLKQLAKTTKDPDIKNMAEYILQGGMTEYLEGMTIKSNFKQLEKELGRGMIMRNAGQLNKLIDGWTNMFEIASRSIAYGIAKQNYIKVGKMDEKAASIKAAEFAKNLANFEQVGEYGKGLGAVFMFFRPSATGAVRAIESLVPAFPGSLERAIKNLPKKISEDPKALATFKKNYAEKSKNARYMFTTLMSAGALFYVMSYMMADDDEMGRNKTLVDDMNKWTRFARFHVPGFEQPFQMPWGFGWGAFAAAGAQLAAVGFGRQSFGDAMFAIGTNIALDSFVPIPVSRMDIRDNPALWALDSAMPSFARPALEFVVNKNGLGQQIYGDSNRRMGDAYMGGDNIPETYKILAKALFNATNGDFDWSPNSIYFLTNSYADGIGKIIDAMVSGAYLVSGEKEFNPKTDLPFLGSFIGAKSNIDNKEFVQVEEKVKKMSEVLNTYKKANPEGYADYLDKNPLAEVIVATYDKSLPAINTMRAEAKRVRMMDISPKEKTELLKDLNFQQNIIKRNIVDTFGDYDIKP